MRRPQFAAFVRIRPDGVVEAGPKTDRVGLREARPDLFQADDGGDDDLDRLVALALEPLELEEG